MRFRYELPNGNIGTFISSIVNDNDGVTLEEIELKSQNVIIPDEVDGRPVVGIGMCFKNTDIKSISLSNSIKHIYSYAFMECNNLTEVILPKGLTMIGMAAFRGCENLKTVTFNSELLKIKIAAFRGCKSLEDLDLSMTKLEEIGPYAFSDCLSLKTAKIPEGLMSLSSYLFSDCINLYSVEIPKTTSSIEPFAFKNCKSLKRDLDLSHTDIHYISNNSFENCNIKSVVLPKVFPNDLYPTLVPFSDLPIETITVPPGHTFVQSVDDVIFTKGKSSLILYPSARKGETYKLPDETTSIYGSAFRGNKNLKYIDFNNCKHMGYKVIYECQNLESIKLSRKGSFIPHMFASKCPKLKSVHIYDNFVSIGDECFCDNPVLKNIRIDGNPTINYTSFHNVHPECKVRCAPDSHAQEKFRKMPGIKVLTLIQTSELTDFLNSDCNIEEKSTNK